MTPIQRTTATHRMSTFTRLVSPRLAADPLVHCAQPSPITRRHHTRSCALQGVTHCHTFRWGCPDCGDVTEGLDTPPLGVHGGAAEGWGGRCEAVLERAMLHNPAFGCFAASPRAHPAVRREGPSRRFWLCHRGRHTIPPWSCPAIADTGCRATRPESPAKTA
jgi:hypothetical protein